MQGERERETLGGYSSLSIQIIPPSGWVARKRNIKDVDAEIIHQ